MILPRYRIAPSLIPGAGQGLFLEETVARGRVLIAPDRIDRLWHRRELESFAEDSIENASSARWFEDWYTISTDWPDECYLNHSSTPTGLWHLGFLFAAGDLVSGVELTADYRFILGSGEISAFVDAHSGARVVGLAWDDNLRQSGARLLALLGGDPEG
jgi:hypothetical protein